MTRESSEHWTCIVCGGISESVLCRLCEQEEKSKQRNAPGSVTKSQVDLLLKLSKKIDQPTLKSIVLEALPDFGGLLDRLTIKQAGYLISLLIEYIEANPPKCIRCKEETPTEKYFQYCTKCYNEIFYNGFELSQCTAITIAGERCGNTGHFEHGLCKRHSKKMLESNMQ